MLRITVRDNAGELKTGAGFHIGDGWVVTARHVLEPGPIVDMEPHKFSQTFEVDRVLLSEDSSIDLALLSTNFSLDFYMSEKYQIRGVPPEWKEDHIPIGGHLDDWLGDELVLSKVLLMGYPRIPQSRDVDLVAVAGEVNAVVDKYLGAKHPHFVISPLGRGGFSGGPVISEYGFLIGVMTGTLFEESQVPEMGFAVALTVEPLWNLLHENGIYPASNADFLREVYDDDSNSNENG